MESENKQTNKTNRTKKQGVGWRFTEGWRVGNRGVLRVRTCTSREMAPGDPAPRTEVTDNDTIITSHVVLVPTTDTTEVSANARRQPLCNINLSDKYTVRLKVMQYCVSYIISKNNKHVIH